MPGIGHLGFGLAAKRADTKMPLWILLVSSELLDIIYLIIFIVGIEDTGWSHSLFMSTIWSILVTIVAVLVYRDLKSSIIIGLLVFSHWVLDFIAWPMTYVFPHSTGMPLFFEGSPEVGLGVGSTLIGLLIIEVGPIIVGSILYFLALKRIKEEK